MKQFKYDEYFSGIKIIEWRELCRQFRLKCRLETQKKRTNYAKITEIRNKNTFRFISVFLYVPVFSLIREHFVIVFINIFLSALFFCLFGSKLYFSTEVDREWNKEQMWGRRWNVEKRIGKASCHNSPSTKIGLSREHTHIFILNGEFLLSITSIIYGCGSFRHIMPCLYWFFFSRTQLFFSLVGSVQN